MSVRRLVTKCFAALRGAAIVIVACAALAAGGPALAQSTLVEEWRWVRFDAADGLPSSMVNGIARAADGTMWGATDTGVAWYDGYRWNPVRDSTGRRLTPARTPYVAAASDGGVLFQSGTKLFRVAPGERTARQLPAFPNGASWVGRAVGTADATWMVVERNGRMVLGRFAQGAWTEVPWPGLTPAQGFPALLHVGVSGRLVLSVGTYLWERRGSSWMELTPFAGGSGHLPVFEHISSGEERIVVRTAAATQGVWARGPAEGGDRWQQFPEFTADAPRLFALGPDGSAVALLDAGDFLYCDTNGWRRLLAPTFLASATAAAFDTTGDVWFSTRGGVVLWRRTSERWKQWRMRDADPTNRINGLAISDRGVVVAATASGVAYLESDGTLRRDPGLPARPFTAVAFGPRESLWAGSGGAVPGVFTRTVSGWIHRTDAPGLARAAIHRIVAGRDGALWLLGLPFGRSGKGGVWRVAADRIEPVPFGAQLDSARFYDMVEDSAGTRWFATDRGVVRQRDGQVAIGATSGKDPDQPFALALGDSGTVWVGLRVRGIVRFRTDLSLVASSGSSGGPTGLTTVHRADDGKIWATNPDGIWVNSGDSWYKLTESFGLPTQAVWPLASHRGDVYVGTLGAGVLRLRPNDLAAAKPRVLVHEPRVEDGALVLRWSVATERGRVAPQDIESRWRLDDAPWSPWSRTATAPAPAVWPWWSHTLWVEARTPLGATTDAPARLSFTVPAPAWWRVEVLVLVVVLGGLLVVLSVLLLRRRRTQELLARRVRDAERMELVGSFAAGMAHELNNLLTTIGVNAELVEDAPGHGDPSPSEEIRRAAMRAASQLRSVLAFTRDRSMVLSEVDLTDLLRQQQAPVSALFSSDVEMRWHIPSESIVVLAEPNAMAAVLRALAEHARSAMLPGGWFDVSLQVTNLGGAPRAELGLAKDGAFATLTVSSSGAGITAEQSIRLLEPIFPARDTSVSELVLVHGLARRFGGAVQVDPSAHDASTLRVLLPLATRKP